MHVSAITPSFSTIVSGMSKSPNITNFLIVTPTSAQLYKLNMCPGGQSSLTRPNEKRYVKNNTAIVSGMSKNPLVQKFILVTPICAELFKLPMLPRWATS